MPKEQDQLSLPLLPLPQSGPETSVCSYSPPLGPEARSTSSRLLVTSARKSSSLTQQPPLLFNSPSAVPAVSTVVCSTPTPVMPATDMRKSFSTPTPSSSASVSATVDMNESDSASVDLRTSTFNFGHLSNLKRVIEGKLHCDLSSFEGLTYLMLNHDQRLSRMEKQVSDAVVAVNRLATMMQPKHADEDGRGPWVTISSWPDLIAYVSAEGQEAVDNKRKLVSTYTKIDLLVIGLNSTLHSIIVLLL